MDTYMEAMEMEIGIWQQEREERKALFKIFFIALILRLAAYWIFYSINPNCSAVKVGGDAWNYYWGIYPANWAWWMWSPGYRLFVQIPGYLFIQIILSALGVLLMFKMNKVAGLLWLLYPISVLSSYQAYKEGLMIPVIIIALYIFRDKPFWRYIFFFIAMLPFQAYGNTLAYDLSVHNINPWQTHTYNFAELWLSPMNDIIHLQMAWFSWLSIPFYLIMMFYFLRRVKIFSFEVAVLLTGSAVFTMILGCPRYREVFMPVIFLWYGNEIVENICPSIQKRLENYL